MSLQAWQNPPTPENFGWLKENGIAKHPLFAKESVSARKLDYHVISYLH